MTRSPSRTRWAALGAAAAVALGAGGAIRFASADSSGTSDLVLAPVKPCKLFDTRPGAPNDGRSTPLGAGGTFAFAVEEKCGVPAAAEAADLTITVLSATKPTTKLTLFAGGGTRPARESINGAAPRKTVSLTVPLSAAGQAAIHNTAGKTHVSVDVTGYWGPHDHDERYDTRSAFAAKLAANPTTPGPKGDTGPVGPVGLAGLKGLTGPPGVAGAHRFANGGFSVTVKADVMAAPPKMVMTRDGFPTYAFVDSLGALKVARCDDQACRGGAEPSGTIAGTWASVKTLALGADGLPTLLGVIGSSLKFVHCNDPVCAGGDDAVVTLDDTDPAATASIAIGTDGNPVFAYYSASFGNLRLGFCGNPGCTGVPAGAISFNVAAPVLPVPDLGAGVSVAIGSDALPVVSYLRFGPLSALWLPFTQGVQARLLKCTAAVCASSVENIVIDPRANVDLVGAGPTSIAITGDGLPVIGFQSAELFTAVAHCNDLACQGNEFVGDGDDDFTTFVDERTIGSFMAELGVDQSLTIGADGLPVVSFGVRDASLTGGRGLAVAHCVDIGCETGVPSAVIVDDAAGADGFGSQLAIGADGLPFIMHWDQTTGQARAVHCSNVHCLPNVRRR